MSSTFCSKYKKLTLLYCDCVCVDTHTICLQQIGFCRHSHDMSTANRFVTSPKPVHQFRVEKLLVAQQVKTDRTVHWNLLNLLIKAPPAAAKCSQHTKPIFPKEWDSSLLFFEVTVAFLYAAWRHIAIGPNLVTASGRWIHGSTRRWAPHIQSYVICIDNAPGTCGTHGQQGHTGVKLEFN
jgi:hypothetical protein